MRLKALPSRSTKDLSLETEGGGRALAENQNHAHADAV